MGHSLDKCEKPRLEEMQKIGTVTPSAGFSNKNTK